MKLYINYCIIFFFTLIIFLPALQVSLLGDDTAWLANANQKLISFKDYLHVFKFEKTAIIRDFYRPLTFITLHFLDRISGGNTVFMHFCAVLIHCINSCLIFFILKHTLKRDARMSLLAALLFSAFALHSQSVIWLCNIHDTFGLTFMLLAFIVFLNYSVSPLKRTVITAVLLITAMCFKENFIMAPFAFIALDFALQKKIRWKEYTALSSLFIIYMFLRIVGYGGLGGYQSGVALPPVTDITIAFFKAAAMLFFPARLHFYLLTAVFAVCIAILLYHCEYIRERAVLLLNILIFILPLCALFTRDPEFFNHLQGRYFYILSVFFVMALAGYAPYNRKNAAALLVLIILNLYMLHTEHRCYKDPSAIHQAIAQTICAEQNPVVLLNIPKWYTFTDKPCVIDYYPAEIVANYTYYNKTVYYETFFIISNNDYKALNAWEYDPYNNTVEYFTDKVFFNNKQNKLRNLLGIPQKTEYSIYALRMNPEPKLELIKKADK